MEALYRRNAGLLKRQRRYGWYDDQTLSQTNATTSTTTFIGIVWLVFNVFLTVTDTDWYGNYVWISRWPHLSSSWLRRLAAPCKQKHQSKSKCFHPICQTHSPFLQCHAIDTATNRPCTFSWWKAGCSPKQVQSWTPTSSSSQESVHSPHTKPLSSISNTVNTVQPAKQCASRDCPSQHPNQACPNRACAPHCCALGGRPKHPASGGRTKPWNGPHPNTSSAIPRPRPSPTHAQSSPAHTPPAGSFAIDPFLLDPLLSPSGASPLRTQPISPSTLLTPPSTQLPSLNTQPLPPPSSQLLPTQPQLPSQSSVPPQPQFSTAAASLGPQPNSQFNPHMRNVFTTQACTEQTLCEQKWQRNQAKLLVERRLCDSITAIAFHKVHLIFFLFQVDQLQFTSRMGLLHTLTPYKMSSHLTNTSSLSRRCWKTSSSTPKHTHHRTFTFISPLASGLIYVSLAMFLQWTNNDILLSSIVMLLIVPILMNIDASSMTKLAEISLNTSHWSARQSSNRSNTMLVTPAGRHILLNLLHNIQYLQHFLPMHSTLTDTLLLLVPCMKSQDPHHLSCTPSLTRRTLLLWGDRPINQTLWLTLMSWTLSLRGDRPIDQALWLMLATTTLPRNHLSSNQALCQRSL